MWQQFSLLFAVLIASSYEEKTTLCALNSEDYEKGSERLCQENCINIKLENIPSNLIGRHIVIYLCSTEYNSSDVSLMKFVNMQEVIITGLQENRSKLNCQKKESGLHFINVSKIDIAGIELNQSGFEVEGTESTTIMAGIYIVNSTNIRISNVVIQNSLGIGLALINNSGYISITDSQLHQNDALNLSRPELFECNCFENCKIIVDTNNYTGGGMHVSFGATKQNTVMSIINSTFAGNRARNGGALHISFNDLAKNVTVEVERSSFSHNEADNGGGTYINAAPDHQCNDPSSRVTFLNCVWTRNEALYGSAVFITPYASWNFQKETIFPILLFNNCNFTDNRYQNSEEDCNSKYEITHYSTGTVYVNILTVHLLGEVVFMGNHHTAVYLFSSRLEICPGSTVTFDRNYAYQGAAIHMRAFASLDLNDNINITFRNNNAIDRGGAIYQSSLADHSQFIHNYCFLKYVGSESNVDRRNISVIFDNNKNQTAKESLFLYSALPCCNICQGQNLFNTIANVTFTQKDDQIATSASHYQVGDLPTTLIPGIKQKLNITTTDERMKIITPAYQIKLTKHNCNVNSTNEIVTNNEIKLKGYPGCGGKIRLTFKKQDTSLFFDVTFLECPPGYVFDENQMICLCSANTVDKLYLGIQRCNHTLNQASLVYGYWAGYISDTKQEYFRTSSCPLGYCPTKQNKQPQISLPHEDSNFSALVCSENRIGIICAKCKDGTSVHYHPTFNCLEDKQCTLGVLFYMLSQLLPVTILFLAVIVCNIQLTTGELNGFIFYLQLFSTLAVTGSNHIVFPDGTKALFIVLNFIVSIFNLKFFNISRLSFCLYKGATSLDVIAFDYITVVYSLLLIILTVILLNLKCYRVNKCLQKLNKRETHFSQSIIHGLSGFLVLCYARTTTTTLKILTPVWLQKEGPQREETRVFYYAEFDYFKGNHLKYAIPALFALIFITLLPPMLLLVYPLCYKVLSWLRLQESKLSKVLCTVIPLEKFKPFFDSFQGAFKDNHRYFAGLYFIYRLSTLVTFAFVNNFTDFYFYVELQLIVMLALHAWVQPYKRSSHNKMDLYIFILLLIVNGTTFYNYQLTLSQVDNQQIVQVFSTIQLVLAYSPIVIVIVYFIKKPEVKAFIKRWREKYSKNKEDIALSTLYERQLESSQANYHEYN